MSTPPKPAERLVGETLADGWEPKKLLMPGPTATGGFFSVGYLAEHSDGREAFLKALDLHGPMTDPMKDPVHELNQATETFQHEVRVLEKCRERKMRRVVVAIDSGIHRFDGEIVPVPYLLFERADGDMRAVIDAARTFDTAWALRLLHQVATGLEQIHYVRIAHQDVKPSNVLSFGATDNKLADFGRSDYHGHTAPHSGLPVPCQAGYAPPELLYGVVDPTWERRRQACDMYQLGSLILFLFAEANATPALLAHVDGSQQPRPGGPSFASALPFLRLAFENVVDELDQSLDGEAADKLLLAYRELCDPDPEARGHPKAKSGGGSQYDLRRYVSLFDVLARKAEMGMLKALRT